MIVIIYNNQDKFSSYQYRTLFCVPVYSLIQHLGVENLTLRVEHPIIFYKFL